MHAELKCQRSFRNVVSYNFKDTKTVNYNTDTTTDKNGIDNRILQIRMVLITEYYR